jgi:hypothetical protein
MPSYSLLAEASRLKRRNSKFSNTLSVAIEISNQHDGVYSCSLDDRFQIQSNDIFIRYLIMDSLAYAVCIVVVYLYYSVVQVNLQILLEISELMPILRVPVA